MSDGTNREVDQSKIDAMYQDQLDDVKRRLASAKQRVNSLVEAHANTESALSMAREDVRDLQARVLRIQDLMGGVDEDVNDDDF